MTEPQENWPRPAVAWYMVGVLMLAYILSFIDRVVLGLLVGPIRADLGVSDTQMSLLYGFVFAFFYTVIGIPVAWAIDRYNRRSIVAASVALWSAMTMLCGVARNFTQLALARIGVAISEAALSPGAYSMAGDSFPEKRLGRALSVFMFGLPVGVGLAVGRQHLLPQAHHFVAVGIQLKSLFYKHFSFWDVINVMDSVRSISGNKEERALI